MTPTPTPTPNPTSNSSQVSSSLRCAIYTRKSSEEGLDMAFNSLDAQREAGTDFIKSQRHQGWIAIPASYDDGGYSGGSTDRPGLQRLLADIAKGRVDVVVVYKVDRLSRSLADFARLMQLFDEHKVSFVSVTQQFNTTTSMGRLTLNMLLSFAQFEREVAGERVRDKLAATFRRGVFATGQPPLGYRRPQKGEPQAAERTLIIVPAEASLVREIYAGYLELGSLVKLSSTLNAAGHRTKLWTSTRGRTFGGKPLCTTLLYRILTNPIYLGKVAHTRRTPSAQGAGHAGFSTEIFDALHEPIIDRELWDRVQSKMASVKKATSHRWTHTHLLKGKIRTFEGHAMSPGSTQRPMPRSEGDGGIGGGGGGGGRYLVRYYVSQKAIKLGSRSCPIKSLSASLVDDLVRAVVLDHLKALHAVDLRALGPEVRDQRIRNVIERVVIAPDSVTIELGSDQVAACAESHGTGTPSPAGRSARSGSSITPTCLFTPEVESRDNRTILTLAIQIKRHDGRRLLLSPDGQDLLLPVNAHGRPSPRTHLVLAIGQAFAWHAELLRTGGTVEALAPRSGHTISRAKQILILTQLAPAVLRAALGGELPTSVTLNDLIAAAADLDWKHQAAALGVRC